MDAGLVWFGIVDNAVLVLAMVAGVSLDRVWMPARWVIPCLMVSRRSLWALGRSSRSSRGASWGRRSPAWWWPRGAVMGGFFRMVSPAMVAGV